MRAVGRDPFSGTVFAFRAKRADRLKLLFFDGTGVVLVANPQDFSSQTRVPALSYSQETDSSPGRQAAIEANQGR